MSSDIANAPTGLDLKHALANTMAAFSEGESGDPVPDTPVPAGEKRFDLGSVLGRGGMGTVFVARDGQFGRDVALKQMTDASASGEAVRRFLVEALVTGNLEHPGIPAVYERGVIDGQPYYAMRKVAGRTLSSAVKRAKTYEERLRLLPMVVQVAHTLGFAHDRGVVHRDVKPDNVVLGDHGETVLLDWGIARVHGAAWTDADESEAPPELGGAATVAGAVMGTPAYMAPEQAAGHVEKIDERTDVFALGAMLYHVLSGSPPYEGPTSMAVLTKALEGERPNLKRAAPKAPPELREIIDTAMAKDPADRYPNAGAFADAVQAFLTSTVTGRPSPLIRALATASGVGVLLLSIFAAVIVSTQLSSFAEQGFGAYIYTSLTVISCVLGGVEWWTKGQHRLGPLVIGFALCTVLAGFSNALSGFGLVMQAGADVSGAARSDLLMEGMWEISGAIPLAVNLAAIQVVLWAMARRARLLAEDVKA